MKLIYTNENSLMIGLVKNTLDEAGIENILKNEYASGATGELSAINTWPELWILDESQHQIAVDLIEKLEAPIQGEDWICERCNEINSSNFEVCWQCQTPNNKHV